MQTWRMMAGILLMLCLCVGLSGAVRIDTRMDRPYQDGAGMSVQRAVTQELNTYQFGVNEPFVLYGRLVWTADGSPVVGTLVTLEEQVTAGGAWRPIASTVTDGDGRYSFTLTRATPGVYTYHIRVNGQVLDEWIVTVGSGGATPTGTPVPTVLPTTPAPTVLPGGATMAQAYASYEAGNTAWSSAWGASDFGQIRSYLSQARAHFSTCLATANQVNDPANAANLALMKKVSTAYVALADAALAMYDGSDTYSSGRNQMNAGSYAAAAGSFQAAAEKFGQSQTLFGQATTTLQSVSFAGTSFGDGTAYIAAIVPVLNGKAAYVGEFATYARGWQYTALAYQASAAGDQAGFRTQAGQAMGQFGILRTSATFGADATSNYNILATMLGGATPAPVTTTPVPVTTTMAPAGRPETGTWIHRGTLSGSKYLEVDNQNPYDAVITLRKLASPPESGERLFSFYLRANDQHRVTGIPIGSYTLWYKLGEDWNPATSSFTINHDAKRFKDTLDYDAATAGYDAKIYQVSGGNAPTEPVSPELV
ncbi:MAG TPA: hypothetical protein PLY91_01455 [Methanoregulaceae archaeon]|nr:hypothetical protein [Methanoregulaceae archaeon]